MATDGDDDPGSARGRIRFGSIEIDFDAYTLTAAGDPIRVEPQVYDVLVYLIDHRSRVVPKEELLDNVWGDRFVSESALASRIKSARRAVGDDGKRQHTIRTVHGRGYQFVADVVTAPGAGPDHDPTDLDGATDRDDPTAPQPPPGGDRRPSIAPPPADTLGREELVAEVTGLLTPGATVTLLGPAGVGKTHLARRIGARVTDGEADGWFVALANVRDRGAVEQAMLDGLRAPRAPELTVAEALDAALGHRRGLLVLDNCEHVLDEVNAVVGRARSAGTDLAVLCTSRQRIEVSGEQVVPVPVLDADAAEALFRRRLSDAGTDPGDDDADAVAVRSICDRLDHLPLALELASAQVRVLGLHHLDALLDERLALLAGLDGAIAWSFDSLDPEVQQTLCRYSVFAGPFDLEAATAVARAGRDIAPIEAVQHLIALADRSLVVVEGVDRNGGGAPAAGSPGDRTYRLLESVRLFAGARLTEPDAARTAHLSHFVASAERRVARFERRGYGEALGQVTADWDNYRAAVGHGLELQDPETTLRLLLAVVSYAHLTQRLEIIEWLERVLDQLDPDHPEALEGRAGLVRFLVLTDLGRAAEIYHGLDRTEPSWNLAVAAGWAAYLTGDQDTGTAMFDRAAELVRGTRGLTELYTAATRTFHEVRSGRDPTPVVERVERLTAGGGPIDETFLALAHTSQAVYDGDTEEAVAVSTRLIELAEATGLIGLNPVAYRLRTVALAASEDLQLTGRLLVEALDRYRSMGSWLAVASDAPMAARVLAGTGRVTEAMTALGAYGAMSAAVGGWSSRFAGQLQAELTERYPAAVGRLAVGADLDPAELCDYLERALTEIIDVPADDDVDASRQLSAGGRPRRN